jgi:hypothetical protein
MQSLLREKLLAQALKLGEVSNLYRSDATRFVLSFYQWLDETEQTLASTRSPEIILLQGEKSLVTSVLDGYFPEYVQNGKNPRKTQRAVAAHSVEKIAQVFRERIEEIDRAFTQVNENMCNAVAVLATKNPELFQSLQANQNGAEIVWYQMSKVPETIPMYHYLSAKLSMSDRNYLLLDILEKMINNRANSNPP